LSLGDRLRMVPVALRMLGVGNPATLDGQTFLTWLRHHRQSDAAIERLWDLVGVSVLNSHADRLSAAEALLAFRLGVLPGARQAKLGWFTVPLGDVAALMEADLIRRGVVVRIGTVADQVTIEDGRALGVVVAGQQISASAVVAAVPHDVLPRLLPAPWAGHPNFAFGLNFEWSGILNWYVRFQDPVLDRIVFAVADSMSPFVFNRGRILEPGGEDDGRLLAISVSDAPMTPGAPRQRLMTALRRTLRAALPRVSSTAVVGERVIVQPHATFRARPGSVVQRPSTATALPGLYRAGDWTATGWPASLEGAVRSGQKAAEEILADARR